MEIDPESSFGRLLVSMVQKGNWIKEKKITCGDCAAYPCFRNQREIDIAGLCYQNVRRCRQECDYFIQDKESGKFPLLQIEGTCKKDNSIVIYEHPCKFLEKLENTFEV
jgi:hypothetical protein